MGKVLVTGADGFVGKHLVKELGDNNIEVVRITGPQGSDSSTPEQTNSLALDLTDRDAAKRIDFRDIDGVIHLAGLAAVGPSFEDPLRYIDTNIGIEINLFEAALSQKASPRFLIISSGSLYDSGAPLPITEQSPIIPSSPYAVSKIGQEQMAHYYQSRGMECIVARPFNHIGPGQNPGFIVPDFAKQIVECEKGIAKRVLVGNLKAERDYTDVRDIVRAYRLLLEKGESGQTYNVCSGVPRSGQEILDELSALSGTKPIVERDSAKFRPLDNPTVYGSHKKLTERTGWEPKIPIKTTLQDVIDDWRTKV